MGVDWQRIAIELELGSCLRTLVDSAARVHNLSALSHDCGIPVLGARHCCIGGCGIADGVERVLDVLPNRLLKWEGLR